MKCPENCPNEIYELMNSCWNKEPEKRPSFKQIFQTIEQIYLKETGRKIPILEKNDSNNKGYYDLMN
jgi:hypothetical protein